ncbi:hypothetical protein [Stenoxybacter acetivorans]|uniref:hypothetical protein n=1 Tax=Stenoxybacter acetivorans TaxID=422441 RepID=UPI0012EC39C9|nr:hypothetical protein [Stenoxybacter acetivorans]
MLLKDRALVFLVRIIGAVDTSHCHHNTLDAKPANGLIADDLRVLAYSRGADGITNT